MMKHKLLLTALSMLLLAGAHAQTPMPSLPVKVDLGIKVGANFEQLNGKTWQQAYKPGIVAGAFVGVRRKSIGVQAEILVNTAQYNAPALKDSIHSGEFKATYLSVPVLFELKLIPFIWLQVGPQYSGVIAFKEAGTDFKNEVKSGDFDGVIGLEAKLPLHLDVGARYILGFSDINNSKSTFNNTGEAWQRRTIQLHVGFSFL